MNRFRRYACLLLLALWLSATMHCDLEAAGVFTGHSEGAAGCNETGAACAADGCKTLEDSASNPSRKSIKAPAPAPLVCACLLYLKLVVPVCDEEPVTPSVAFARPLAWVPVWPFARRAAPSPRAPSVLV